MNLIFHIALPLCAFIAGASASLIIYRGLLRDLQSQLTTTNAMLEVERELKDTAAENAEEATAKLAKERKYWSATKAEMDDSIKAMLIKVDELTKEKEQLTQTCDDIFDTLVNAVSKMPVPFHLRRRDESGRFIKRSSFDIATALHREMAEANMNRLLENAMKAVTAATDSCIAAIKDAEAKSKDATKATELLYQEIKANAVECVNTESAIIMGRTLNATTPQVYRSKVLNAGYDHTKGYEVVTHDESYEPCQIPDDEEAVEWLKHGNSVTMGEYHYTTNRPS